MSSLLETADLGVRYGGVWALRDLNLQVEEGEIHGFIGPNGSGKSTFFNAVTGRCRLATGEVRFKGRNLHKLDSGDRARLGITLKFQVTSVFAGLSVLDNILLGILGPRPVLREVGRRKGTAADLEKAEELLTSIGLWDKRRRRRATLPTAKRAGSRSVSPSPRSPRFCCSMSPLQAWAQTKPREQSS